jgi:hypothetical protein
VIAGLLCASGPALARAETTAEKKEASPLGLRVSGFVQADAVLYRQSSRDEIDPATGEPLNEDRFSITRARLRADVDHAIFGGALELDGNTIDGPVAQIIEAQVSARWKAPIPRLRPT